VKPWPVHHWLIADRPAPSIGHGGTADDDDALFDAAPF
jgi:hypothetical protein